MEEASHRRREEAAQRALNRENWTSNYRKTSDAPKTYDREQPYLWQSEEASKVLTVEEVKDLSLCMDVIKYNIHTEQEFKYLQFILLAEKIDKIIRENKDAIDNQEEL